MLACLCITSGNYRALEIRKSKTRTITGAIIARFSASRMAAPLAWNFKFRDVYLLMAALRLAVAGRVRERRERAVATM